MSDKWICLKVGATSASPNKAKLQSINVVQRQIKPFSDPRTASVSTCSKQNVSSQVPVGPRAFPNGDSKPHPSQLEPALRHPEPLTIR